VSEANGDGSSQIVARRRQKSKRSTGAFASAPLASTERQIPTLVEKFAVKEEAPRRHLVPGTDSFRTPSWVGLRARHGVAKQTSRVSRFRTWSGYPSIPALSINPGNGAMGHEPASGGVSANSRVLHRASCTTVSSHSCVVSQLINTTENCRNCLAQRMGWLARHCGATPADVAIRTDQHGAGPIKIVSRHECFIVDCFCLERK